MPSFIPSDDIEPSFSVNIDNIQAMHENLKRNILNETELWREVGFSEISSLPLLP